MSEKGYRDRRQPWSEGPDPAADKGSWLALTDDDLLSRIQALGPGHAMDPALLEVVRSTRHFFIRQEAAKKIGNVDLLKAHASDRHIGEILVRRMTRSEDVAYLEKLKAESHHLHVRNAAEAQLRVIAAAKARKP